MRAWFINLGPPSLVSPEEANADLNAIWDTEPALLLGCESVLKGPLPKPGKDNQKIRDISTPGRANIFAFIRDVNQTKFAWKWVDCNREFPRLKYEGIHPPRSILRFPYQGAQIVVGHKPYQIKGSGPACLEYDQKVARIMDPSKDPDRSRLYFSDCNGMAAVHNLAEDVRGRVIGDKIDCAIVRRVEVLDWGYRTSINGHRFHTDHKHGAFYMKFKLRDE